MMTTRLSRRFGVGLLFVLFNIANADIYTFMSESLPIGGIRARPGILYNKQDSPEGDKEPRIINHLTFTTETPQTGLVEVILIEGASIDFKNDIGVEGANGEKTYCCIAELRDKDGCGAVGTLIVDPQLPNVYRQQFEFAKTTSATSQSNTLQTRDFPVKSTGRHTLIISNCGVPDDVTIDGQTLWINPYGYLPGQLYGYLPFYADMSILYISVAFVWFLLNAYNWQEVVMLQNYISVVLGMCLVEMATWYFDYVNFNTTGVRHIGPFVVGIITSVLRRAVSRMLVIAVALGFGVVRPSLGEDNKKILGLGATYFVFGTMLELIVHYGQTNAVAQQWRMLVTLPVAAIDAYTYWWIFISLYQLMTALAARKQTSKLGLYQRFLAVLVLSLIIALGFAFYQMYYMSTGQVERQWRTYWLMENGFWQILYTFVLFSIMVLWRPNKSSRRYAYAELHDVESDSEHEMEEFDDYNVGPLSKRPTNGGAKEADDKETPEPLFEIGDEPEHADDDEVLLNASATTKMV